MSHLMASVENMSGFEDTVGERVSVGAPVVYYGRIGHMRQGRTRFPARVLQQHEDDGSLDLLVDFEPEDSIWERRVHRHSEANPGHAWGPIEHIPGMELGLSGIDFERLEALSGALKRLREQIFGEWQEPPKAVMDYLADFDVRLRTLEEKLDELVGALLKTEVLKE